MQQHRIWTAFSCQSGRHWRAGCAQSQGASCVGRHYDRAMFRSQSGPVAGIPFLTTPSSFLTQLEHVLFPGPSPLSLFPFAFDHALRFRVFRFSRSEQTFRVWTAPPSPLPKPCCVTRFGGEVRASPNRLSWVCGWLARVDTNTYFCHVFQTWSSSTFPPMNGTQYLSESHPRTDFISHFDLCASNNF